MICFKMLRRITIILFFFHVTLASQERKSLELEKYFSSEFCELTDFEKSEIAISIFKFTKLIFDQSK